MITCLPWSKEVIPFLSLKKVLQFRRMYFHRHWYLSHQESGWHFIGKFPTWSPNYVFRSKNSCVLVFSIHLLFLMLLLYMCFLCKLWVNLFWKIQAKLISIHSKFKLLWPHYISAACRTQVWGIKVIEIWQVRWQAWLSSCLLQ